MTKTTKSRKSTKKTKVALAHSQSSKLRHFRLVHGQHSGKVVGHHHTSYLALACLLAIVGLIIYTSRGVWASPGPIAHNVSVMAYVAGLPPAQGATITSPTDGAVFTDQNTIEIDGTCQANTTVVLSSNNSVVGSANCSSDGTFKMNAQLDQGQDVLSTANYDVANQAGPDTPNVTVTLKTTPSPATTVQPETSTQQTEEASDESQLAVVPQDTTPYVLEQNPDQSPCDNSLATTLPTSIKPKVAVTCIPRVFKANIPYTVQFGVWGGTPPYAVDIDWGTKSVPHTLISLASTGYKIVPITYAVAGNYTIRLTVRDSAGLPAYVQAAATVPGVTNPITAVTNAIAKAPWFSTPVPAYTLAVTVTAGFWVGEAFTHLIAHSGAVTQYFRPKKPRKKIV